MSALADCVLVVDDEFMIAEGLWIQLEDMGLTVCGVAGSVAEALAMAQEHRPKLVLMDVRLSGDGDGVDAAMAIHQLVGSKMIFVTGSSEPKTLERIKLDHASAVLTKPVSERKLKEAVRTVLGL